MYSCSVCRFVIFLLSLSRGIQRCCRPKKQKRHRGGPSPRSTAEKGAQCGVGKLQQQNNPLHPKGGSRPCKRKSGSHAGCRGFLSVKCDTAHGGAVSYPFVSVSSVSHSNRTGRTSHRPGAWGAGAGAHSAGKTPRWGRPCYGTRRRDLRASRPHIPCRE